MYQSATGMTSAVPVDQCVLGDPLHDPPAFEIGKYSAQAVATRSDGMSCHTPEVTIVWRRRDRELRQALVEDNDASGKDFSRARLVALDLHGKRLQGCNFEYTDLTEANLEHADLRGANLHGASLTGARFAGANLIGARLDEAMMMATEFRDAALTDATLVGAIWDQNTAWPSGYKPKLADVGRWHGRTRPSGT